VNLQIIGPPPRPDVAYRVARERAAEQQRAQHIAAIHTRADTTGIACPSCASGIYDSDYGYCPGCGFERTTNGHAILNQRSATTPTQRCGLCGIPWEHCYHGYQAQGRA
jgi:hypothetical protein